jgi:hypothetical protein
LRLMGIWAQTWRKPIQFWAGVEER